MIYPIFGINFPRLDETVRFVKLLEIILRTDTYISLAMKPVERLNADFQELPAYSHPSCGGETYDAPDRRFPIGNPRRHDAGISQQLLFLPPHHVMTNKVLIVHIEEYTVLLDNKNLAA